MTKNKKSSTLQKRSTVRRVINKGFVTTLTILTIIWIWKLRTFPFLQLRTLIMAAIIYLIWAYAYHYFDKSLTVTIYIEYLLTAVLALILLLGVLV